MARHSPGFRIAVRCRRILPADLAAWRLQARWLLQANWRRRVVWLRQAAWLIGWLLAASVTAPALADQGLADLPVVDQVLAASRTEVGEAVRIRYQAEAGERQLVGEVLVTAQDGGRMILTDDGQMLIVQPETVLEQERLVGPLVPLSPEAIGRRMLSELPAGFAVHETANYLIVHNTNPLYARWVGGLFESLHRGFHTYFKNQGFTLKKPRFPLIAVVFADQHSFQQYATAELGDGGAAVIGYYNLETNRMITFNVPNAERNVATLIHEATHQLAYNTGLQTRFADNPMWLSEGLALFFESPNFNSPKGWQGIGRVNTVNLARFHRYLPNRPADSLLTLLSDDSRFRHEATMSDAYAEAWAMTYFLIRTRRKDYFRYLQLLSDGQPLVELDRRQRVALFQEVFGEDLEKLDRQFLLYLSRVR